VSQVRWDCPRQARLSAFLKGVTMHAFDDGRPVGRLLARAETPDVVDAHLVICAVRLGHDILSGDSGDLGPLAAVFGPAAPVVHTWS
jgi:hypothetical protein